MNGGNGNSGLLMTVGSTLLYVISRLTVSDLASMAAIFAGLAAGLYNGYKFIELLKEKKKNKKS